MHANGFPPSAYKSLLNKLTLDFQVNAPLLRSFWPNIPKDSIHSWEVLAEDFLSFIDLQEKNINNIGIGHSIGGTLLFYSAIIKPELFSKIILLDPVLFSNIKCTIWKIIKILGLGMYFHPLAKKALYRKQIFKSKKIIFNRYRKKNIFSKFSDESLRMYIESIIKEDGDNYRLNFSSKIESDIYLSGLTLEKKIFSNLDKIKSKIYIMYADSDSTISASNLKILLKNNQINQIKMDGLSHLFPMEDSNNVYGKIREILI